MLLKYIWMIIFALSLSLQARPIKVASYNVQNLFDASFDATEYPDYIPNTRHWNKAMVEIKLNHTAEVICDIEADIIGLQEIENTVILKELITRLKSVGCGTYYFAISKKKGSAIQVALLSRYPIMYQKDIIVSKEKKRVRNILEVKVEIEGNPLLLFVNHWKSKAYFGVESKRLPYAKALQERLAKIDTEYILLGDFNSNYNAYLRLEEKLNDTQGYTAFNDVLQTKIGEYLVNKAQIQHAPKGIHYSLWTELAIDKRWSTNYYGITSTPDHIVLGASMFDGKGLDYINSSFAVYKAKYLFTKKGYINRWQYKNKKHKGKGYSDHLPIYAYFDTKPYQADKEVKPRAKREIKSIETLYTKDSLENLVVLKDVKVIFKRGNHAIIKQTPKGRGIMLYGCAKELKEGHQYDLLVEAIKRYKGLKEITHSYILEDKGAVNTKNYYTEFSNLQQNEVIRNIEGEIRGKFFYTQGEKVPIHFRKKKLKPKDARKIKIYYAHVGYYKKLQLVIYSQKDFKIMEK